MPEKYLTQVTAQTDALADGDLFLITDVSDNSEKSDGTNKKLTFTQIKSGLDTAGYIKLTDISVTDSGGDGSLSYNSSTGVFTYTGPSAAEVRAHLSVGSEATASGDGALSYNSSTGVFTYTPPTLAGLNGSIDDLTDVTLTSTADNDILRWNGSAFVNTDAPTLDALQFDLTAAETAAVGQLAWNSEDLTLDLGLDTNVTLQIGQEQVARIKATTAIRNGMAVYVSGVTGGSDNLEGTPFSADSASGIDELRFLGIATETLSTNDIGFVTTFGKVRGVNGTTYASGGIRDNADTESWSVGDILYASPNIAGTLTSVVPTSPDRRMAIAIVLKLPSETNITIFARAEHGYHLNELHNVLISGTPADNEVLAYDSASGNWINQTLAEVGAGSGTVTSVAATVPTGFTISGSPITSSGTLAVSFDTGYSLPTTSSQINWNTAYGWGDHSTAGYLTDITGENLSSLSDVTITSIASGELIKWNGSAWINNTLAEAGIAATGHTHATSDITSGTFADARIAESNVTQHQSALSITESQISDLGSYITASSTDTFTNKTFDANGTGNSLSNVETADIASGSKSGSDTTLVTGTAGTDGNVVTWNADGDAVDSGYAVSAFVGGVNYQGTWNASTNSPTIPTASSGNKGYYYKVSVAGSTSVDGETDWKVGDWIISNGTTWDKVDNTESVSSVFGRTGAVTASFSDISGTATHEQGGLEADVSAYSGLLKISGGATSQVTDNSSNWDTSYGWGDHSLAGYLTDITGEALSTLSDVTITSIASGEILKWSGTAWINNTLAEAGIAATGHTHATSDITSGTFADARIAQSNVTQHQAALSITESQISDLGSYITASSTNTLTNKTFDANGTGNSLSNVETADIASGSKTGSDTTLVTGTAGTNGNLVSWNADGDAVDSSIVATNVALTDGDTYTGTHDFGGATLEIPNAAAPSLSVAGQIALDTSTTDHTALLKYHDGTNEFVIPAILSSGLSTTDNDVIAYNAANNRFEMEAQSGSGGGISNVVEDTTPQLGGQLDVNGQAIGDGTRELLTFTEDASAVNHVNIENQATGGGPIISAAGDDTNIDLNLAAKGTGDISLGTMVFDADQTIGAGQDNYVLTYDNATGKISLEAASGGGGGISNVVEDTTPQLGGQLDVNGNAIGDGTRELLTFTEDASAVNHINIENQATGGGPIIRSTGTDTNVDLNLQTKGSGDINLESLIYSETNKKLSYSDITGAGTGTALTITSAGVDSGNTDGATGGALSLGSGDAADSAGGNTGNVTLTSGVSTTGNSGSVQITSGGSATGSGSITLQTGSVSSSGSAGDIILAPASDAVGGTYGDVRPDGDGVQNLGTASNRWKAFYQTTNYFVETGGGANYVAFTAPSSIASDVTWTLPNADGSSGQVLSTNGSGTLSWATASGGGGSSSANTEDITQASHGFAVGDLLKFASGSYAKAQADSADNAEVVGIVSAVAGANDFTITYSGRVDGLSGLSANTMYFLDPSTAGSLTSTEPSTSGEVTKPVLFATSTTSGIFITYRGAVISSGPDDLDYQWIGAGAMIPRTTNGAAPGTAELATNDVMLDTMDFDASTEEGCAFWTNFGQKWNAGTVKVKFYWTAASGSGTAKWDIAGQSYADSDAIDQALGTEQGVTDTLLTANDMHITSATSALTIADATAGEPVYLQITRDVATDTLGVDAQLIGVMIEYTKTSASGW